MDKAIAEKLGIGISTLWRWRQNPKFIARVDAAVERINAALERRAVGHRARRVDRLNRDWHKLQRIVEERATSAEMKDVPGGTTGLIVHNVKGVGRGEDFQLIDLYEVDTGLLQAIAAIEKQASQELGQWVTKQEHSGPDGASIPVSVEAQLLKVYGEPDSGGGGEGG